MQRMRSGNTTSAEKSCQSCHRRHVIEMMEELVNKLAELQAEMESIADQIAGDRIIQEYVTAIAELEKQASDSRDALHDLISAYGQDLIDERMNEIKDQIIDEWDGEKKTLEFGAGTLKFRTTTSVDVKDGGWLLESMSTRLPYYKVYDEYIKGFNLTAVRKYIDVIEVPEDVVKLVSKTTAKLEQ